MAEVRIMPQKTKKHNCPQVKVCGLTSVEEAVGCADLGANAIGCVFFPKSPRHLSEIQAKEISMALPSEVKKVGVFVNESFPNIMHKVEFCRLNAVQLHGRESPELVSKLLKENLLVIKALFIEGKPTLDEAETYEASAFLVECGRGVLPGGNAIEWDWKKVKSFGNKYPMILAGGLAPENISHAISVSMPDAVDVSSGVESASGQKDLGKVKSFLKAVSMCELKKTLRKIF